jgi:hypothetical protein
MACAKRNLLGATDYRYNAYDKPCFSQIGYYRMHLLPPGKVGAGFGDLNAPRTASDAVPLFCCLRS